MWYVVRLSFKMTFVFLYSEKSRFSLKGPHNQGKRFRIYRFLLKNFTDEQRFNITTRICQDVLGESICLLATLFVSGTEKIPYVLSNGASIQTIRLIYVLLLHLTLAHSSSLKPVLLTLNCLWTPMALSCLQTRLMCSP